MNVPDNYHLNQIFLWSFSLLPMIQEGQLSVTGEKNVHRVPIDCFVGLGLPRKSVVKQQHLVEHQNHIKKMGFAEKNIYIYIYFFCVIIMLLNPFEM